MCLGENVSLLARGRVVLYAHSKMCHQKMNHREREAKYCVCLPETASSETGSLWARDKLAGFTSLTRICRELKDTVLNHLLIVIKDSSCWIAKE